MALAAALHLALLGLHLALDLAVALALALAAALLLVLHLGLHLAVALGPIVATAVLLPPLDLDLAAALPLGLPHCTIITIKSNIWPCNHVTDNTIFCKH